MILECNPVVTSVFVIDMIVFFVTGTLIGGLIVTPKFRKEPPTIEDFLDELTR